MFKLATHPSLIAPLSPHTQCRSDVDLGRTSKHGKEIPTYKLSSRLLWPNRPSGCTFSAHRATRASVWRRCVSETRSFLHCSLSGPLLASHFVSECLRPICALFGTRCAYLSPSLAALGAYLCPLWQALVCISALLGHPLCLFLPSWVAVVPMSAFFSFCLFRRSLCLFLPSLAPF